MGICPLFVSRPPCCGLKGTEVWDEVQSVDRFGYKWQMTTIALVGVPTLHFGVSVWLAMSRIRSAPCIRLAASRLLGGIAGMARSYNAAPDLIGGFSTKADIRSEEWLRVMALCARRTPV